MRDGAATPKTLPIARAFRAWSAGAAMLLIVGIFAVPRAALAQSDIVGEWLPQNNEYVGDPEIGEYEGLPLNAASRRAAHAWSSSLWTVPEHQCIPHPSDYAPNFSGVRFWKDVDPVTQNVIAYHTNMAWMNTVRTIWMDGRAHPPADALHTWEGFSTGVWEGDMLTVTTTHMKAGYLRRNGTKRSPDATLIEHFIRVGNELTWVSIVYDAKYTTEPYIKSLNFKFSPGYQIELYPCSTDVEVERPEGQIPHFLTVNPDQFEYADKHKIPHAATEGGAETMYPEYQKVLERLQADGKAVAGAGK